jgi:hypothetical protein
LIHTKRNAQFIFCCSLFQLKSFFEVYLKTNYFECNIMRGENVWLEHEIDSSVDFLLNRRRKGPKLILNVEVKYSH